MIREAYIWALSKAVPGARKAGLVYEIAGIAGRFQRHRKAWEPHLNTSRRLIAEHAAKADPAKPILLLGAGHGLDVPLDALARHRAGVTLCDAVSSPLLRRKIRRFKNLSITLKDITGFLEPFWLEKHKETISPPAIAPVSETGTEYGLVVSCNLLSQLPLSFARNPPVGDTEIRLTAAIQQAHIKALKAMNCPVLLITDYERLDQTDGQTEALPTAAPQLLPGEPLKTWDWHIAPKGELAKNRTISLKVGAWLFSGE